MADNYKDKPENKGLRGAWRRGLPLGKAGETYKHELEEGLARESFASVSAILPLVFGVPFLLLPGAVFLALGGEDVRSYVQDEAIQPGVAAPYGYSAISADDGKTGYVLIHDGEMYRLYGFETNDKDERVLTYVADRDNAWHAIRQAADNFSRALTAAADPQAAPPAQNIETFRFAGLSKPVTEDGKTFRIGTGIADADEDYANIQARLSDLAGTWMGAAQEVYQGHYGYVPDVAEARKGGYTETRVRDYTFMKWASIGIFGISGLGFLGVGAGAAGRTARTLRSQRDKKPGH